MKASTFTAAQKQLLLDLVDEWIRPLNRVTRPRSSRPLSRSSTRRRSPGTATEIGNPIYYRVQGPTFVIEFAHQQGEGANAGGITHIHSIYREPGNDYGAKLTS